MNRFKHHSNCRWTRERIDRFLDAELDGGDLMTFQGHVDVCSGCRRELARAETVLRELHSLPDLHCRDEVVDRALAAAQAAPVARHRAGRRSPAWWPFPVFRPALAGALILALVLSSLWVANRSRSDFTPADVADAEEELKWTLAYLDDIGRRSSMTAMDKAFQTGMVGPLRRAVSAAFEPRSPVNQPLPLEPQSPTTPPGGGSV